MDIKIKHLDVLITNKSIHPLELLDKKNNLFNRIRFKKSLYILNYNYRDFLNTDITKIELRNSNIKIPSHIDNISFKNMIKLNSLNKENLSLSEIISKTIAIVCYKFNKIKKSELEKIILDTDYKEAMGIFNWINKSLKNSKINWENLFFEVEVIDSDYQNAGADSLNKFSILNTIKGTCSDFNITYKKAWNMPYSIIQTNKLAKATSFYVQNNLQKIKEQKMKRNRGI